jgi:hypothetical protein
MSGKGLGKSEVKRGKERERKSWKVEVAKYKAQ